MKEKILNTIKQMQKIYSDNQLGIYAGNATLFIITAVFPLLMLIISVVGMLPGYTPDDVTDFLFQFLPDLGSVRSLVNNMISNLQSHSTGLLASVAAVTTLWSASAGTTAVQAGLQKVAQIPKKGVRDKLVSLLFTLLYVILIPALLILQVLQESILNLLTNITGAAGIHTESSDQHHDTDWNRKCCGKGCVHHEGQQCGRDYRCDRDSGTDLCVSPRKETASERSDSRYDLHGSAVRAVYQTVRFLHPAILSFLRNLRITGFPVPCAALASVCHHDPVLWGRPE